MPTKEENRNNAFLVQGLFLALASVISRLIGLIYRIPLTAIIGKVGNDYYGTAFSIYNILLIISSYSLPLAISKMVATRMADNHVKDTKRVLNLGLIFATLSGGIAFALVFFGADFFAGDLLKTPSAAVALRVLSPALLIVAIIGVLRGFFQGLGTMVPSAISQIIEQIINAIVSVLAAYLLVTTGSKISSDMAAAYGAAGGTLGTVSGAAAAFLFLIFVHIAYRKVFKKKLRRDKSADSESTSSLFFVLIMTIIPVLLSTTLYNISAVIDQGIYKNIALSSGFDAKLVSESWGVYVGQVNVIINIPLAIANSIAASIVPSLAASHKRKDRKALRAKIRMGLRFVNIITFPCMVGFLTLGGPIMRLLFNDFEPTSGYMLMAASISVVFYAISTLSNGILQGIDKMRIPVIHAAVCLSLQAILLYLLMSHTRLGIYAVIISTCFYSFMMCILNEYSVKRYTKLRYSIRRTYILPLLSSLFMGVIVLIVYYGIYIPFENNTVACITSIIAGMCFYFIFMIGLGGITKNDLENMPKGHLILKVLRKIGLFK